MAFSFARRNLYNRNLHQLHGSNRRGSYFAAPREAINARSYLNRFVVGVVTISFFLIALTGCGSNGSTSSSNGNTSVTPGVGNQAILYVVAPGTPAVGFFNIAQGGILLINSNNYSTGANPQALVTDSRHRYVYVLNNPGAGLAGGVLQYEIASGNGSLQVIQATNNPSNIQQPVLPAPTGNVPLAMAIDPNNQFVFVANSASNSISVFSVGTTYGDLNAVPSSPTAVGNMPVSLVVKGNYLFVANKGDQTVSVYSFDSTGKLTILGTPVTVGANTTSIASDGHYVYVADGTANTVSVLSFSAGSGLAATNTSVPVGTNPVNVYITPGNKYLYVANMGSNNVSGFTLNGSGGLSEISGSPFGSGQAPDFITSNSAANDLFVANAGNGTVSSFTVKGNGALDPIIGSPYQTLGYSAPNGLLSLQ